MKRRPNRRAGASLNITSLCDIMLSLLIFFMLVSRAGLDTGADKTIVLPLASLGITEEDLEQEHQQGAILVLNIDASMPGQPRAYGKLFGTGAEFSHDTERLRAFVQAVKGDREDFIVAIHADARTPFYDIQPVLQAVNAASPAQVRFAFSSPR